VTQLRCQACGHFYDKKLGRCPECGAKPHGFNKHLHIASLNNGLYKQAERAEAQKRRAA
jgi:predicted ATP-dependent serine protease